MQLLGSVQIDWRWLLMDWTETDSVRPVLCKTEPNRIFDWISILKNWLKPTQTEFYFCKILILRFSVQFGFISVRFRWTELTEPKRSEHYFWVFKMKYTIFRSIFTPSERLIRKKFMFKNGKPPSRFLNHDKWWWLKSKNTFK